MNRLDLVAAYMVSRRSGRRFTPEIYAGFLITHFGLEESIIALENTGLDKSYEYYKNTLIALKGAANEGQNLSPSCR